MITIPKRYSNVSYNDVPDDIKTLITDMLKTRKGIYIYGGVGTGKTHIAYAIAKHLADKEVFHSRLHNTTELFREFRNDFDRVGSDKERLDEKLLDYRGIIILDDIGAEKISDWVAETFYLIVNKKYNDMIPMIFTSNLSPDELAEKIGDRTVSRIVQMCDVIELKGSDRRLDK